MGKGVDSRMQVCYPMGDKQSCQNDKVNSQNDKGTCQKGGGAVLRSRLKERRAALGVNQQELGRMAGVSRQTISLIERGDYSPSVTLALTLAKICGVTVEDIFSLEEENDEKQ